MQGNTRHSILCTARASCDAQCRLCLVGRTNMSAKVIGPAAVYRGVLVALAVFQHLRVTMSIASPLILAGVGKTRRPSTLVDTSSGVS